MTHFLFKLDKLNNNPDDSDYHPEPDKPRADKPSKKQDKKGE